MTALLEVNSVGVRYGNAVAVDEATLRVDEGEWVALIGPNGAGKSSLLKAILGLVAHGGEIRFAGRRLDRLRAWSRQRLGIGYAPEGRRLFPGLSVEQNLLVGGYNLPDDRVRAGIERAFEIFPRLGERRRQSAGTLSGGEQQMLALARALMSRPRLLLVDEASLGLMPLNVNATFKALDELHRLGHAILLVEQNARMALKHAGRAYLMETGRIALEGPAAELARDPRVLESYVG
jgi:branched-chain amino acid transport system ATP-binding protein